eukprot:CAMPEP_0185332636 /NCGR_PEP_ID=MMETSP1363-20130426/81792_1 /TAXON_ID=38817 /ORGANISM="Gephyrocapsa oceanica, Strain RCC1303" /LENGTH=173 /DNA_ID=CAMNT_0027931557 /DNA_START=509 /DNA_END=1027 /DNA_ORIENTATION=-
MIHHAQVIRANHDRKDRRAQSPREQAAALQPPAEVLDTVATDGKVEWRPQAKGVVPQLFVHRKRGRRSGAREAGAQPSLRDRVSEKDQAGLWCRCRRRRLLPVQAPPPHLSRPAGKVVARDTIARDWWPRRPLVLKLSGEWLAARPDAAPGRWVAAVRSPPQLVEEGAEDRGR